MSVLWQNIKLRGSKGERDVNALFDSGATYSFVRKDIAEKICYLLDNDEIRYEMGQVGKKRCQEKFRWPVLATQFDNAIFTWLQSIES